MTSRGNTSTPPRKFSTWRPSVSRDKLLKKERRPGRVLPHSTYIINIKHITNTLSHYANRFEEENFMRLPTSKKDKQDRRKRSSAMTIGNLGDEVTHDFGKSNFDGAAGPSRKRKGGSRGNKKSSKRKKFRKHWYGYSNKTNKVSLWKVLDFLFFFGLVPFKSSNAETSKIGIYLTYSVWSAWFLSTNNSKTYSRNHNETAKEVIEVFFNIEIWDLDSACLKNTL